MKSFLNSFLLILWVSFGSAAPGTTAGKAIAELKNPRDELIVAVGDHLEHVVTHSSHSEPIPLGSYNASMLVALAYDPGSGKLFFSDRHSKQVNIFSVSLEHTPGRLPKVASVVDEGNSEVIEGMTFDPIEQSLLWADESKLSIRQVSLDPEKSSTDISKAVELVSFIRGDKPRTLMADHCNRMMYWINWNHKRPTIESSLINGTERQVLIEEDLRTPRGLTLDLRKQKIYWANNLHFGSFRIERSNTDGSDRELVHSGTGQFVFSLAVSDSFIYWTDWEQHTLWALQKDISGAQPQAIRHFNHKPMAVVMFGQKPVDCATLSSDHIDEESSSDNGDQVAQPYESEVSMCEGYCFNDGSCVQVGSELECRCPDRYIGDRCQDLVNVSIPIPTCSSVSIPFFRFEEQPLLIALIGVSVFALAMLFAVIGLTIRIHRLGQQPRLRRRRFIGFAKKQSGDQRDDGPVIDIENCCNMNICETPCVEPPSRTPTSERCNGSGGKSRGKDRSSDKQKLLDCDY